MPNIFVERGVDALAFAPSDSNDGYDTLGIGEGNTGGVPTWNPTTRTYTDALLAGQVGADLTDCWVCVKSGTNWTAGMYQIESFNGSTGVVIFRAAAGINTTNTNAPVLSTGPLATFSAALGKVPGTVSGPYTSYAANSAVRIAIVGTTEIASALSWSQVGAAAYHNRITSANAAGWIETDSLGATLSATIQPAAAFTTGTILIQSTFAAAAYTDVLNITFNGSANGKTATYALDLNAANGDLTFINCTFTGGTTDGLRCVGQRVTLYRCRGYQNGQHGLDITGGGLASIRMFSCEAFSNTFDGINLNGSADGAVVEHCLTHHNSRHGLQAQSSNRSAFLRGNISSHNGQHGFDLAGAIDAVVVGNISVANGTTGSHRQFHFNATTHGTRALFVYGNYAGAAAGGPVNTDATDLSTAQLTTGESDVLVNTVVGTYDGRLKPAARTALKALVGLLRGALAAFTTAPGLPLAHTPAGGGSDRIYPR